MVISLFSGFLTKKILVLFWPESVANFWGPRKIIKSGKKCLMKKKWSSSFNFQQKPYICDQQVMLNTTMPLLGENFFKIFDPPKKISYFFENGHMSLRKHKEKSLGANLRKICGILRNFADRNSPPPASR